MMIKGIDHLVLTVRDLEVTLAFYKGVLGFTCVLEPNLPAALIFGSQKINVHHVNRTFEPKAKMPTCGSADFCLIADRPLNEVKEHLSQNGVDIEVGPVERIGARGPMNSIYFRDPDGNLIEVSEYPT